MKTDAFDYIYDMQRPMQNHNIWIIINRWDQDNCNAFNIFN